MVKKTMMTMSMSMMNASAASSAYTMLSASASIARSRALHQCRNSKSALNSSRRTLITATKRSNSKTFSRLQFRPSSRSSSSSGPSSSSNDHKRPSWTSRMRESWRKTPVRWTPLPIAGGIALLVAINIWKQSGFSSSSLPGPPDFRDGTYDSAKDNMPTVQGPWQVRSQHRPAYITNLNLSCFTSLVALYSGPRRWCSPTANNLTHLRSSQLLYSPCMVQSARIQAILVDIRCKLGGMRPSRPKSIHLNVRLLPQTAEAWYKTDT